MNMILSEAIKLLRKNKYIVENYATEPKAAENTYKFAKLIKKALSKETRGMDNYWKLDVFTSMDEDTHPMVRLNQKIDGTPKFEIVFFEGDSCEVRFPNQRRKHIVRLNVSKADNFEKLSEWLLNDWIPNRKKNTVN